MVGIYTSEIRTPLRSEHFMHAVPMMSADSLGHCLQFCHHCADLGDMESLFREFDEVLFKKAVTNNRLGLLDASSLLWRLTTIGVEVGEERWKRVTDALATHVNNHRSPWLVLSFPLFCSLSPCLYHSLSPYLHHSLSLSLSLPLSPGLMLTS